MSSLDFDLDSQMSNLERAEGLKARIMAKIERLEDTLSGDHS